MKRKVNKLKKIGIIAMFLSLSLPASSQEYIDLCSFISDYPTTVREVSVNKWLFCQRAFFSSFFYVSDTSSLLHSMDFLAYPILINDFEIYSDWVFFCGESTDPSDSYAFVGKFNITLFPSSTVYFYKIDRLKSLTKIEVKNGGLATVDAYMIGQDNIGKNFFVSANLPGFGNPGSFYFSEATDGNIGILDDIAITRNYVVVSGRNLSSRFGYLYYFNIPSFVGAPYATNTYYGYIGYTVDNPILIKHCTDDYIVTVSSGSTDHIISALNGISYAYMIKIPRENGAIERDLDYNKDSRELDLLIGNPENSQADCFSYIYHLGVINATTSPAPFNIHNYANGHFYSLRKTSEAFPLTNRFITSGGFCSSHRFLWYRYNSHQWKNCSLKLAKDSYTEAPGWKPKDHEYFPEGIEIKPITLTTRIRHYEHDIFCPERDHLEESEE